MNDFNSLYAKFIYLIRSEKIKEVDNMIYLLKSDKYINNISIKNFVKKLERERALVNRFRLSDKSIYFYIINDCDYNCIFCDRSSTEFKTQKNFTTNVSDIKFILNTYKDKFSNIDTFEIWWHEPLANKNIINIFKYLSWFKNNFILNTSWSRPDILEKLILTYNFSNIFIPIYWSSWDIHNNIVWMNNAKKNFDKCVSILYNNNITFTIWSLLIKQNKDDTSIFCENGFSLLIPNNFELVKYYKLNALTFQEYVDFFQKMQTRNYCEKNIKKINIFKYFNILNYTWETILPLCILYNLIDKVAFMGFIEEIKHKKEMYREKYINSEMKIIQDQNRKYCKPLKCKKCNFYSLCNGFYEVHFEVFWKEEPMPIL